MTTRTRVEDNLSDVLSEFARTLVTDFPIQGILDHLVKRIVDVLPISAAGVTLISPTTEPRFIAASDESAMRFETLQSELGEGPCLAAYDKGFAISVADLRKDQRFPRFATQAVAQGLVAVFTFPLSDGERRLGALDLYRTEPGALDERGMEVAQTLADVASAYLVNAQVREDLRAASEAARHASLHDGLTGLPNRALLLQRLEHAIVRSSRTARLVVVLYVDLDRFKDVNDTFGHHTGDSLLCAVAHRISGLLRTGDTLARLAGDEFVVLCEELDTEDQAERVGARIVDALAEPFGLPGAIVPISASVGIASLTSGPVERGDDLTSTLRPHPPGRTSTHVAEQLLQQADMAMYRVKKAGGADHGLVDQSDLSSLGQRAGLTLDLRMAVAAGELRTDYQPILSPTRGVVGAEALSRWAHPVLGAIPPATFIPLAEETGLMDEVGRFVLGQACRDRGSWPNHDGQPLGVSVNVSPLHLMSPDFGTSVRTALADSGTPPELVTIEITEGALIADHARALVVLTDLKRLGVTLALDDFGTGSSSLSHLRDFAVDLVKIDQSFVSKLMTDSTSRHIVEAVVTLAHRLGMRVVAEGVETRGQLECVLALGFDYYQGHLFSPAVSSQEFVDLAD